jgi:hypothetical protein
MYRAWTKTQWNTTEIKVLRSDRGREYLSGELSEYLDKMGTMQKLTIHDMPKYNGVVEHLNCTLLEKVQAMFHASSLPKNLWGKAVMHSVYIKNCTSTRTLIPALFVQYLTHLNISAFAQNLYSQCKHLIY